MAKDSSSNDQKTSDKSGGETYTASNETAQAKVAIPVNQCPDCKGQGIRNPALDRQVCATCGGRGSV